MPWLILVTSILVGVQPWINRRLRAAPRSPTRPTGCTMSPATTAFATLTGVYGGYFGAGSGVMMMAVLGFGLDIDLRIVNALKTLAVMAANVVATLIFLFLADLDWAGDRAARGGLRGGRLRRCAHRPAAALDRAPVAGRARRGHRLGAALCPRVRLLPAPGRSGSRMSSSQVPEGIDVDVPPSGTGCADCDVGHTARLVGAPAAVRRVRTHRLLRHLAAQHATAHAESTGHPSSRASSRARTGSTTTRPDEPFDGPVARATGFAARGRLAPGPPRPGAAGLDGAHPPLTLPLCRARSRTMLAT